MPKVTTEWVGKNHLKITFEGKVKTVRIHKLSACECLEDGRVCLMAPKLYVVRRHGVWLREIPSASDLWDNYRHISDTKRALRLYREARAVIGLEETRSSEDN